MKKLIMRTGGQGLLPFGGQRAELGDGLCDAPPISTPAANERSVHYPRPRERYANRPCRPWIFKITQDFKVQTMHLGRIFESEWLLLEPDGVVTIKANQNGYAWDGCSPKWSVFGLAIVGTPDGHIDIETGYPLTYYASLVHDAFYQYLEDVPVSKADIDSQFYKMLQAKKFPLADLYYWCVQRFGGLGVLQKNV
jgi:hypothetical protein